MGYTANRIRRQGDVEEGHHPIQVVGREIPEMLRSASSFLWCFLSSSGLIYCRYRCVTSPSACRCLTEVTANTSEPRPLADWQTSHHKVNSNAINHPSLQPPTGSRGLSTRAATEVIPPIISTPLRSMELSQVLSVLTRPPVPTHLPVTLSIYLLVWKPPRVENPCCPEGFLRCSVVERKVERLS